MGSKFAVGASISLAAFWLSDLSPEALTCVAVIFSLPLLHLDSLSASATAVCITSLRDCLRSRAFPLLTASQNTIELQVGDFILGT